MNAGILAILLGLLSTSLMASVVQVHSQFQSKTNPNVTVLKLSDGSIGFWNHKNLTNVKPNDLKESGVNIDIIIDENQDVVALNLVSSLMPQRITTPEINATNVDQPYTPTILESYAVAREVLASFNTDTIEGAQCYDKAHRWVYDEYAGHGTKLMKIFLFFSDDYVERVHFKWWFHAAPFTQLRMSGQTTERVLDPTFSGYPLKFKLWTDLFMSNKVDCKEITSYKEYSGNPHTSDCFIQRTPMYTWQPRDLEAIATGTYPQKTAFIPWEIDWAYEHGFGAKRP
jgi:hypothetical protein